MLGRAKSLLESNPYPPEILGGLKQNLVCTRTRDPTVTEPDLEEVAMSPNIELPSR